MPIATMLLPAIHHVPRLVAITSSLLTGMETPIHCLCDRLLAGITISPIDKLFDVD